MKEQIYIDTYFTRYDSPLGLITLQSDGQALTGLDFGEQEDTIYREFPIFDRTKDELDEYFSGIRKVFTIPLSPTGTDFQREVWDALLEIPYGETRSYEAIAIAIGNPKAFRAIGMANNRNPIGIIIPCHRVIAKDGSLGGYDGGLDKKIALLELEKRFA